ncbi:MAG: hypothetical protein C5B58_15535 [Acidobacteria bacterium]|nr:MAG: hypothetical protein C5B58_15535 [Acidobacteriota bacterium]
MQRLILECAVRAALLVMGTALVLYLMRVKFAAAKHKVWTCVLAVMLVLPIWTAWGPKASLRLLPALPQTTASNTVTTSGTPPTASGASPQLSMGQAVLLGIYMIGFGLLLLRLAIGTMRAHRLISDTPLHDSIRTSPLCAAPVTVGFFHPVVIFPEQWRQWSKDQLHAVLTHENEHARRRDSLVQWLALLNRALFWFHPAAWWLERTLSSLAEEACDNVVLARGHNPREYAQYILDMARSVARSGVRLKVAGMAMNGSLLSRRIKQIMEGHRSPRISRRRMACIGAACAITGVASSAGTLGHVRRGSSAPNAVTQRDTQSTDHPTTKYVLGNLKIEGDVHDRNEVRDRIFKAWKDREYYDPGKLINAVVDAGVIGDFQERGYFRVVVDDVHSRFQPRTGNSQPILITTSVMEGSQFQLRSLTIQNVPLDRELSIPPESLRNLFHIRDGDLFNVAEIREGLERVVLLYHRRGYPNVLPYADTNLDDASHRIDVKILITEGQHKP